MEKIINIGGKDVTFKKTGATLKQYNLKTGRSFIKDLLEYGKAVDAAREEIDSEQKNNNSGNIDADLAITDLSENELKLITLDVNFMYDILYVMAKSADPTITNELDWLDSFDTFPVIQIFIEVVPLLRDEIINSGMLNKLEIMQSKGE